MSKLSKTDLKILSKSSATVEKCLKNGKCEFGGRDYTSVEKLEKLGLVKVTNRSSSHTAAEYSNGRGGFTNFFISYETLK